jgi:hypothetical protein
MVFCGRWKNRTDRNRKQHEPQPQIARTATANCMHRNRKLHEPQPQTARTATANRTNRNRKPHEPQRNRSVNLFLGSTVVQLFKTSSSPIVESNEYGLNHRTTLTKYIF